MLPTVVAAPTVKPRTAVRPAVGLLSLTATDTFVSALALWGATYLLFSGRWVPGWAESFFIFLALGAGPMVFRAAARVERLRVFDRVADFWLLPGAVLGHQALGPLVDAVHPGLVDASLAQVDLQLFGQLPAAWVGRYVGPAVTDLLLVCYYGYFLWPLLVGVVIYAKGQREAFHQYTLALAIAFAGTFFGYLWMPAIGPRFFLSGTFDQPLTGLWLTPWLDSMMRGPEFVRDCFPSGHTAITLVMLAFAYRYARRWFWAIVPAALGLIAATLVGRFHYGVDLICALPLALVATTAATLVTGPSAARSTLAALLGPRLARPELARRAV